ncbi:nucleoside/nucleotide kinase family protein [Marinibacterium sp. SX1]|uniref:nucleoside/nucleotide kinase family protein n=1 Tax=Marinibacterium sp. SX1 TaxID=3388424 RepID=UPI003D180E81
MSSLPSGRAQKSVSLDELLDAAHQLLAQQTRRIMAIVGPPGAGKSTLAEKLRSELERSNPGAVAILPMDGFHYDDAILKQNGRLPWKGAPDTFDVGGLCSVLSRLVDGGEAEVAVPVFDRELEISRGSARIIQADVRLILLEGNYLLLNEAPWSALGKFFGVTVMIDVAERELERRLRERWLELHLPAQEAAFKIHDNDLPNGNRVRCNSAKADFVIADW